MQNHVKVYLKHFGYSHGEYIPCENCGGTGSDIHHLKFRSQGGNPNGGDNIANLMCLCRDCHHEVHFGTKIKTDDLIEKHLRLLGIEKATIADDEQHEVTIDGKIIFKHEK
jgi:5-methylcytosine-specific restriction endonuclease McrA